MSFVRYILLAMCLLWCALVLAQKPHGVPVEVRECGDTALEVVFHPSTAPRLVEGRLLWDGLVSGTGMVGCPDLPMATVLLRMPLGSSVEVGGVDGEEEEMGTARDPLRPLLPVAPAWIKGCAPPVAVADKEAYSTDALYRGGSAVQLDYLGAMGLWRYYRLALRPVAYNPRGGEVRYFTRMVVKLSVAPSHDAAPLEGVPPRMLVVAPREFRQGLQPFVQWKRQEGYDVVERYADTHLCDSVRGMIEPFFTEATPLMPAPRYVLLVGDTAELQPFVGTNHPSEMDHHPTDLPYVRFGGALLPAAHVGRWPVGDTGSLGAVVRKTLAYEQGRSIDTAALRRVLLVAGYEQTPPAPTSTNGQVDYLKREITMARPAVDTLCHYNPASRYEAAAIASEIGQGVGLLNYTAHCTAAGWTSPAVTEATLDTLRPHMPSVYVNNCCKSNDFSGDAFGERLLRMPQGGAVGVIGATNNTLWAEDYYWAVGPKTPLTLEPQYEAGLEGAFDRWVGRLPQVETLGELLAAGNLAVTAYGSIYSSFYWETYCLLGDPSLRPLLGIPARATAAVEGEVCNGQCELALTGTPFATVTAVQDTVLLGTVQLDSLGLGLMPLRQSLLPPPLLLTASGRNMLPSVDTLTPCTAMLRGIALRNIVATDSMVRCNVENIGQQRYDNVSVTLMQSQSDSLAGVLAAVQNAVIDSLLPGMMQEVVLPVEVASIGHRPLLQATLLAAVDDIQSAITVRCTLPDERPALSLRLFHLDGAEVRRLMPSTSYRLCAEVEGQYDSLRLNVLGLSTDSSCLTFTTPTPLCRLQVEATLYRNAWHNTVSRWLVAGNRQEGFEGGFAFHPWDTACRVPWTIDTAVSHSGRCSARSGAIGHGQISELSLEVFLPHDDTISYWLKVSSEPQHDQLVFTIDGERQLPVMWGNIGWRQRSYPVSAGHHTLCWRYQKDHSTSHGQDCAWLDDIEFPMVQWEMPAGWLCVDSTVGVRQEPLPLAELDVYPNPASAEVTLRAAVAMEVAVYDAAGRRMATFGLQPNRPYRWDVSQLMPGVYFAQGRGSGSVCRTRFIKLD